MQTIRHSFSTIKTAFFTIAERCSRHSAIILPNIGRITPLNRLLIYLSGIFILSRIFYYMIGIRFDATILHANMQLLDLELLRNNLLESLFYLHIQPPLFNLFVGLVLKFFPEHTIIVLQSIFLVSGLILYLAIFLLQVHLGITKSVAALTSTIFLLSPSYILFENMFFYTFPVAMILTVSMLFLYNMLDRGRIKIALCFFISLFVLCGIRSTYHLLYYFFIWATVFILYSPKRNIIVLTAVFPFLLLLSFYLKNYIVFGKFTTSSWMGMNLSANMEFPNPIQLIAEGKISEVCFIPRFAALELYPEKYCAARDFENIPALSSKYKSDGTINY